MEVKNEVAVINPAEYGLDVEKVKTIEDAFAPKIAEKEQLSIIYSEIIKSEITEDLCKRAGDTRKKLVKVRTGIADIHKTQKAFFLAAGRFCDAWKNKETQPIEQMEEKLSEVENYFVKLEAERIAKLKVERENLLSEYTSTPAVYNSHLLTDESFSELLTGLKLAKEAKEAERKAKNAPDKDKLIELAKSISEYKFPELKGEEANKILNDVKTLFTKVTVFINDKSASL